MTPETRRNQAGQDQSDDPRQAVESGEPEMQAPLPGHVTAEQGEQIEGETDRRGKSDDQEDWESGRQQAL